MVLSAVFFNRNIFKETSLCYIPLILTKTCVNPWIYAPMYSRTPLCGHLLNTDTIIITDGFLCLWGKKALTFSLKFVYNFLFLEDG